MVRRRQKGDPPSPRLYKEGHYPPSCRDTRFTIPYATTAARAAAAVGLTVNAAVSGGIFSSRPRRGDPPAAEGDGRPYTQAGDLAMAVQRHYLTIGGVSQGEAEGVRRQHSRITQRRVARSRTLDQAASPRRASARPPRSLSG